METILQDLHAIVGDAGLLLGADVAQRPAMSLGKGSCEARAIVRPATPEELSQVMALCHRNDQPVVPWGGLTGLVNGATAQPHEIAISLERMTAIEEFDEQAGILVVQAGAPMQKVQEAAADKGWLFALDLGARGTATIGGNIATNAGGNSVLRYGMMRQQVLGLEAVLADGTLLSSMNQMLKNNAGYDLKHLFIGTEGTLGIVTRAVLRLHPLPRSRNTAFVGVESFAQLSILLRELSASLSGQLSSFEVMWGNFYRLMTEQTGKHPVIMPTDLPYYVLIEATGNSADEDAQRFEQILGEALESGTLLDAVIAQSETQADNLWAMRDDIETLVQAMSPLIAFDVSLPIKAMEQYVQEVETTLLSRWPEARLLVFGHMGDGNLHLIITTGADTDANRHAVETLVYEKLVPLAGSVSAEHGIGLEKRQFLPCSRSDVEIALMKTLKQALDPKNLLNPGKVI
ncbi:FAD-binding oxidoreductase [Aestuariirhabdus litorea]|uniref:FAD-binding oxidoreductase n=1 Tax=Aestuariirhabdus litorea TaxID=2528527 RepID=A0A3P3VK31_9GAMM|nr:FAD-binding oxidoreductase [Aestuariirhabdus litorea]RRJ82667.1 FAD-binding oxidoreductase [Aestuariirhabdus litorea]RWW92827.1 FAD-binding protein [Endozoicomonadaceae bacterium GTF-13]